MYPGGIQRKAHNTANKPSRVDLMCIKGSDDKMVYAATTCHYEYDVVVLLDDINTCLLIGNKPCGLDASTIFVSYPNLLNFFVYTFGPDNFVEIRSYVFLAMLLTGRQIKQPLFAKRQTKQRTCTHSLPGDESNNQSWYVMFMECCLCICLPPWGVPVSDFLIE